MVRGPRTLAPLAAFAFVMTARLHAALADPPAAALEIFAPGDRSWDAILREIQDAPATLGHSYALGVRSLGTVYGCSDYTLTLDAVAQAAFAIEGCDAPTGLTELRVRSRAALFDESGFVPRPRRASVYASLVQHARADGGGARPEGGSRVGCSVHLEPYLWDGLRGVAVPLPWGRFELRPLSEDVHAAPDGAGWIARGESHMSVRFRYEVIDRATGERVVDNEAALVCDDKPAAPPYAPEPLPAFRLEAPSTPTEDPAPRVRVLEAGKHSVASLKLKVVELALLRNDTPRFQGALQLGPYNGANDFMGGFQVGITNTAGVHPWALPLPPSWHKKGADPPPPDDAPRPNAFRGVAEVGAINTVDGDFSGAVQVGGVVTFVGGSFRGLTQIGGFVAGMGGHSVAALQLGGFVAYAKEIDGIQISPCIATAETVRGIQFGGCGAMTTRLVAGLQLGGGNMVFEATRRGENVPTARVEGAQIGMYNYASEVRGAQVSAFNIAMVVHGVQVGAVNYAKHLDGIQIGAINIASNGVVPFMPVMNAAFGG